MARLRLRCALLYAAALLVCACSVAGVFAGVRAPAYANEPDVGPSDVASASDALHAQAQEADFYAVLHEGGELVFQAQAPVATESAVDEAVYEGSLESYISASRVPWLADAGSITSVRFDASFAELQPRSLAYWFSGCKNMHSIDLQNLDASKSTTMRQMFLGCSSLVEIDNLAGFDTSSSTYFGGMFRDCASLKNLDVSHFDATHVEVLCFMFNGCSSLEALNMSGPGWDTRSLGLMVHVWEGCTSLKSLDLSHLNTSNVRSMTYDFNGCSSLEYLDLSGADTSSVGNLKGLLDGCTSLKTVKLGSGFTFNGSASKRQCALPDGNWKSSATGEVFAAGAVPNNVAATYTKTDEEVAARSPEADLPGGTESPTDSKQDRPGAQEASSGLSTGDVVKVSGAFYVITSEQSAAVALRKAATSKQKVVVPASVKIGGKRYEVAGIAKGAFKGAAAKQVVIKSQVLTKKSVKGCFKGAKNLKRVKVPPTCAKSYVKFFAKANSGKNVAIV